MVKMIVAVLIFYQSILRNKNPLNCIVESTSGKSSTEDNGGVTQKLMQVVVRRRQIFQKYFGAIIFIHFDDR